MRDDMHKVLVNRPGHRTTPRWRDRRRAKAKQRAIEGSIPFEPLIRGSGERTHWTGDHFGPLKRYLRSQVGRPWNKVWSEVCEDNDSRSTVQDHVRLHVEDFVHIRVVVDRNGDLRGQVGHWGGYLRKIGRGELYVCPKSGLLRELGKSAHRKSKRKRKKRRGKPWKWKQS